MVPGHFYAIYKYFGCIIRRVTLFFGRVLPEIQWKIGNPAPQESPNPVKMASLGFQKVGFGGPKMVHKKYVQKWPRSISMLIASILGAQKGVLRYL